VAPDVRDQVIDYVGYWSGRTELPVTRLCGWAELPNRQYHRWKQRYGKVNEHNAPVPRDHWLEDQEKQTIVNFAREYPLEGYRRLTYMLIDLDRVAVSPASVYRVLREAGLVGRRFLAPNRKGTGFVQPEQVHEHWHVDFSYINVGGTFYYLCSVLDGASRYIVHWEIRESMKESDAEMVLQRAREKFPDARPRLITDRGSAFVAKDFKEFLRHWQTTHVFTSPHYPQSNGKLERFHRTLKHNAIRPKIPLTLQDARRVVAEYITHYNDVRLHSAIYYVTPRDRLEDRHDQILKQREDRLAKARQIRKLKRQQQTQTRVA
jgi:transposase InsO family protein